MGARNKIYAAQKSILPHQGVHLKALHVHAADSGQRGGTFRQAAVADAEDHVASVAGEVVDPHVLIAVCQRLHHTGGKVNLGEFVAVAEAGLAVVGYQYLIYTFLLFGSLHLFTYNQVVLRGRHVDASFWQVAIERCGMARGSIYDIEVALALFLAYGEVFVALGHPLVEVAHSHLLARGKLFHGHLIVCCAVGVEPAFAYACIFTAGR